MKNKYDDMSDDDLYELSMEKRKNGNGTSKAYEAQREILRRGGTPKHMKGYKHGSSKRYAYNDAYMFFEEDNR